ncbi:MAG: aminotransferase class I/II-fold pyridoxal phosphate-dependent enzyme [Syntrophobacteraceae bacterium]
MGDEIAYTYLQDGETQELNLSYRELEQRILAIAARLQSLGDLGDRVLLMCPPGIEFVTAFFGTTCAGLTAVPAYPPHANQTLNRLEAIAEDAEASIVLSTKAVVDRAIQQFSKNPLLSHMSYVAIEDIPIGSAADWREPDLDNRSLALLQYTSGSTGKPKGVMVSHANLLHNVSLIHRCFGHAPVSAGVSWLPPYHDMGLVGCVIYPLYVGFRAVLMSPVHFLQKPSRWLEAISRYQANISGGPNFAYDLCARKISTEERSGLDLSSWHVAFNGAEPIRAETIDRFTAAFSPCGFRRSTFHTCYGLAEATLLVSGQLGGLGPATLRVERDALRADRLAAAPSQSSNGLLLVGCGDTELGQTVLIADPETRLRRNGGEVGEIWVSGPSVAQGYWRSPEETRARFRARLADTGEGPFLRTGDLGFLDDTELFVTGRLKDLIIIRGRNHYPQDIEFTVETSHPALRIGCGAAFSVDVEDEERLVVVHEVERSHLRSLKADEVTDAIRQAVSEQHELQAYAVVLIKPFSIPKTSSGKVQRHLCRAGFLRDDLRVVAQAIGLPETTPESATDEACANWSLALENTPAEQLLPSLERHLRETVARLVRIPADRIDPRKPLKTLGIDSLMTVELQLSIEKIAGASIPLEAVSVGASIADLAAHILWQMNGKGEGEPASPLATLLVQGRLSETRQSCVAVPGDLHEPQPEQYRFDEFPELRNLQKVLDGLDDHAISNPYFKEYQGINRGTCVVGARQLITFSSYDYLGFSGHPSVANAAKEAIDRYGTSVSASRVASGERPVHRELEKELAQLVGVEDSIALVSGHAANVTTIGHLFGKNDLVLYDALIHNSVLQGCALSEASHHTFPHCNWEALDAMLRETRSNYRRVLVVIEGLYSMDGDIPDLPAFIEVKKRHRALLMVDEAHSIGVLGPRGRGIAEHFAANPADVDLWMGTLSKSLASCGGYLAGCRALIEYLKYTAPGFVYSVGMTPANAAAALAAVRLLKAEPERVTQLHGRARAFWEMAQARGLDTGTSSGFPIVPVIVGQSLKAMKLSEALFNAGIDVLPMVYPAVPDKGARLRFFVNFNHTMEQIAFTLDTVARELHTA